MASSRSTFGLGVLACLAIFVAAVVAVEDQDIQNGFFPGRSGDMIFRPKENLPTNIAVIFRSGATSTPTASLKTLEASRFAPLLAHLMGTLSPVAPATRADFPAGSLFDKPSANLFIAVDALSADLLDKLSGAAIFTTDKALSLTPSYYPVESVSFLTTLLTGVTPSEHGIVGKSWLKQTGETVFAYEPSEEPQTASLTDEWVHTAHGTSLLLSGSGDRQLAAALSPNPLHLSSNAAPYYAFFWNGEAFESLSTSTSSSSSFTLSHATIETILRNGQLPLGASSFRGQVRSSSEDNSLEVTLDGTTATFHLDAEEDFTFFAELALLSSVSQTLSSDSSFQSLVHDGVPDFYSFALVGLRGLQARYGVASPKVALAASILDAAVVEFVTAMEALYGGRLLSEIAMVDTSSSSSSASEVQQAVIKASARYLRDEAGVSEQWPSVYLRGSIGQQQKEEVCASVEEAVTALGWEVHCPKGTALTPAGQASPAQVKSLEASNKSSNSALNYEYSYTDIQVFHVVLWMSIVLVIVLLAAWLALHCMDVGEDSIIYRQVHISHPHKS